MRKRQKNFARVVRSPPSNTSNEMAIYKQGILGPFSGKVGTVVGSSWRGIAYIRSLAAKVGNPRTQKQVSNRARFSTLTSRLKHFLALIKQGFIDVGNMSPWSAAIKTNLAAVSEDDAHNILVDMQAIVLSNGTTDFEISASKAGSTVDFSWTAPGTASDFFDGELLVGAYNVANGKSAIYKTDLSQGAGLLDFSAILTGEDDDVHIYYFAAASGVASPTVHIS